ncbi:LysE family translocator [Chelatococcus sp. SYSU_G07232]|uniref:LysE family translocator n=1 Tax=Chelatococcus albus TaxID=3047466 RepID=A0ABT7AG29_9HYPH|nr:LysE family translocator [Chelatococcus sp. SYSU_G07232]MDJ1158325.1 LysE family translocator [Chelatococcus sp. SYSU_G07232]
MLPIETGTLAAFALVALGMVLTPGPNMIYLVSRSITQGWRAGAVSLLGVAIGFVVYMVAAAVGLTALALAVPFLYEAIKWAGALCLLHLAWQAVRPGGSTPFAPRALPHDGPARLFAMGLLTNLLNPKIAVLYMSLLPQFVDPARGDVLLQNVLLGVTQIGVSVSVNLMIVLFAGAIATFLARRPLWLSVQRYLMGAVLAGLAVRLATDRR